MKFLLRSIGLVAAFSAMTAAAQHAHPVSPPGSSASSETKPSDFRKDVRVPASAFAGYRTFDPNEPRKDWRVANEEVQASGGHMRTMEAAGSPASSHVGHDAPTPAREGKP
jgi:hypothetical protein